MNTCPKCGLPVELCVCEEMVRKDQKIRVRTDKRRYGKLVTVVEGFEDMDLDRIAKELKTKLACGGTIKEGKVVLQGDHLSRLKEVLVGMGFSAAMID
ncbi:MAG: translation initiation factor [Candidatus Altiarchaeota archaeon]